MYKGVEFEIEENDVIKHWVYTDKIYVSIVCPCFNQESYISEALCGFLSQITKFKFEIIIHDDASTDNTPEIIDYFVSKFPSIVKFIKQDENQYSISRTLPTVNVLKAASGDFVALCEGDDYWIDKYKIDKQLRILSKSGKNICFTQAESINEQGQISKISCYGNDTRNVDFEDVILGGGSFMCTPTIMFNRNVILELIGDWFFRAPVGDYFLQVLASQEGAVYIPDITARYRLNSTGSWSSEQKKKSTESIELESSNMESAIRYIFPKINISSKIEGKVCSKNYLYWAIISTRSCNYKQAIRLYRKSFECYGFLSLKQVLFPLFLLMKYLSCER